MTIAPWQPGGNVCVKCEMWAETWLRMLVSWNCISGGRCENEIEGALSAYGEGMPQQKPLSLFHIVQICPGTKAWLSALLATKSASEYLSNLFLHLHFWLLCKCVCFKIGLLAYLLGSVFISKVFCCCASTLSHEMPQDESFRSVDMCSSVWKWNQIIAAHWQRQHRRKKVQKVRFVLKMLGGHLCSKPVSVQLHEEFKL